jgi:hypothetical protein
MNIYFTYFHYVPVTLVASRTFSIPSCLSHSKLTSQLVLARPPLAKIFCGGTEVASGVQLFVRALFLARLPRNPHTPGSGARGTHRDQHCSEVHQDLIVSKNAAF